MNENIDLTKILKDCPKGWELYSCIHGKVRFKRLDSCIFPVSVELSDGFDENFSRDGRFTNLPQSECCLFPSNEQRDWSKFTAPWYKKDKFDPKTLKSFDKVLVRNYTADYWCCGFFSYISMFKGTLYKYVTENSAYWKCIPYNDDTKHLVGTTDEAPEYYRYWEE